MIQVDPNKRPSADEILEEKWFVGDTAAMNRISRIYDLFNVVEVIKRKSSASLERAEAKKPKAK
jgi:hypothetical protein